MSADVKALVDLLRSAAMERMLDRVRERAEDYLPGFEVSADPRLHYRAHYANQAEQCREEIATVDALRAAVAQLGGGR